MRKWWLFVVFLLVAPSLATVFRTGNTVTIPADQVINDDLVASGSDVSVNGKVTGDVVAAGSTVRIAGPVGGDLIVAGGNVNVSGPVGGTLYAASGNVELNAPVKRNVLAAGGTVTLGRAATVGRDVSVSGGNVTVGSKVGRNLRANASNLTLAAGAVIGGNLIARAQNRTIAPGAKIAGTQQISRPPERRRSVAGWFLWQLFTGAALLVAGLIFVAFAPRLTEETETSLRTRPGLSLGVGVIVLLIGLPLFLLLLVTVIGIPLALIWMAAYFTAVYLSPIFAVILVGRLVWRRPGGSLYLALLIGIGLLVLVRFIPFLDFLATLAAVLFGLGALVVAIYDRGLRHRAETAATPEAPPPAAPEAPPQAASKEWRVASGCIVTSWHRSGNACVTRDTSHQSLATRH
jgi:MFS family permease